MDLTKYVHIPGEEGPSLMGLEDVAMFRALPTATIFYPCDGVSTEKAVELAATTKVKLGSVALVSIQEVPKLQSCCHVLLHLGCLLHPNQPPRQPHYLQQQRGLPCWTGQGKPLNVLMFTEIQWGKWETCYYYISEYSHTENWQIRIMRRKITHFPFTGGLPEQRGPGDCGCSWSNSAWVPGSSWLPQER